MFYKVSGILLVSFIIFTSMIANGATGDRNLTQNSKSLCDKDKVYYHNETKSCYYPSNSPARYTLQNVPSPCGRLQYFYAASQEYGACDCITDDSCTYVVDFNRPVINWPGSGQCYYIYEQGPCKSDEWIVLNSNTFQSECKPNPCKNLKLQEPLKDINAWPSGPEDVFWFLKNNTCYQTFTRAYCKEDEYVRFIRTLPKPFCVSKDSGFGCGSATTSARLPCAQGHKRVGDDCIPVADID